MLIIRITLLQLGDLQNKKIFQLMMNYKYSQKSAKLIFNIWRGEERKKTKKKFTFKIGKKIF